MNRVSCDICVYHLGLFVVSPAVFFSSRVTGACPVTTDLIIRFNVRTTTTRKQFEFQTLGDRKTQDDTKQGRPETRYVRF